MCFVVCVHVCVCFVVVCLFICFLEGGEGGKKRHLSLSHLSLVFITTLAKKLGSLLKIKWRRLMLLVEVPVVLYQVIAS